MIHNRSAQLRVGDFIQVISNDRANLSEAFSLHFLVLSDVVKRKGERTVCCVVTLTMKMFQVLAQSAAKLVISLLRT